MNQLPVSVAIATRRWLPSALIIAIGGTIWASAAPRQAQAAEPPAERDSASRIEKTNVAEKPSSEIPRDLKTLINRIRENEALYRNIDATFKESNVFAEVKEQAQGGGFFAGPFVLKSIRRIDRIVTSEDRFLFSGAKYIALTTGRKFAQKQQVVFDGKQTVAIAPNHSATIFHRRREPAAMVPPHNWGMWTLRVSVPLSTYLSGTDAIRAHPRGPRNSRERGDVYEFNKVEAEFIGQEKVDDLDCIKVKVKRWYYTKSPPAIQYLWLATDRNYHVAQVRTAWTRKEKEVPGIGARVTRWQEVARQTWLPTSVISEPPPPTGDNQRSIRSTQSLRIDRVTINPELPDDFFQLPDIPPSLPKFVIGNDGLFKDSPQHPTPIKAAPDTTLDTIFDRLAVEEARYKTLEVNTTISYRHLNTASMGNSGLTVARESQERTILAGKRLFFESEKETQSAGGNLSRSFRRHAFDGTMSREIYEYQSGDDSSQVQRNGSLALGGLGRTHVLRAHTPLFSQRRDMPSLAAFLKSGWSDKRNGYRMTVKYVGDEHIAGLHCHKLKCNVNVRDDGTSSHYFLLWLARDRNLIPIRRQWHSKSWIEKLPTGIKYAHDLRQIQPGIWFPYQTTDLAFQKIGPFPNSANLPLLQWRRDLQVDSLIWNPEIDETLFNQIEVPANTRISVRDEQDNSLGQYEQAEAGNINITPQKLLELRQAKKK